jgi:hypothetical protein
MGTIFDLNAIAQGLAAQKIYVLQNGEKAFAAALLAYLTAARQKHTEGMQRMGCVNPTTHKSLGIESWRLDFGKVRVRIVHDGSARAFVDYATGDVLKCAGWAKPAKHARGNIFDAHNGAEFEGTHGPAYLR